VVLNVLIARSKLSEAFCTSTSLMDDDTQMSITSQAREVAIRVRHVYVPCPHFLLDAVSLLT
jgi:hypothetical protein